jgi:hypothetical protein
MILQIFSQTLRPRPSSSWMLLARRYLPFPSTHLTSHSLYRDPVQFITDVVGEPRSLHI